VEQRIGSSKQPLDVAGVDPAYIPGLTVPGSREPEDAKPEAAGTTEEPGATGAAEATDAVDEADPAVAVDEADAEEADAEDEGAAGDDGPVFEASDRRASIRADRDGVRLKLDDQECEFRWDEIAAVETETPRFGKRFTVTVHTPQSRWYFLEIEAAARSRFAEWEKQLDAVLDAYFDDGDEPEEPEAQPEDAADTEDAEGAEEAEEKPAKRD
jgi:hypothetical protein